MSHALSRSVAVAFALASGAPAAHAGLTLVDSDIDSCSFRYEWSWDPEEADTITVPGGDWIAVVTMTTAGGFWFAGWSGTHVSSCDGDVVPNPNMGTKVGDFAAAAGGVVVQQNAIVEHEADNEETHFDLYSFRFDRDLATPANTSIVLTGLHLDSPPLFLVPALSTRGLAALATLMLAAGVWVLRIVRHSHSLPGDRALKA